MQPLPLAAEPLMVGAHNQNQQGLHLYSLIVAFLK